MSLFVKLALIFISKKNYLLGTQLRCKQADNDDDEYALRFTYEAIGGTKRHCLYVRWPCGVIFSLDLGFLLRNAFFMPKENFIPP